MPPSTTLWNLEDHTHGKHLVLEKYLEAWLPIILQGFDRARFIDAFAGPGEYAAGEPGSPLIALNALAKHKAKPMLNGELDCVFIEKEQDRFDHLCKLVEQRRSAEDFPVGCKVECRNDKFQNCVSQLVVETGDSVVPTFVMVDPFGVSDTPMSSIAQLMQLPSTEVYVSVMMEHINRLAATEEFEIHLDELYGCEDWRDGLGCSGDKRREFFCNLYENQLRTVGNARFVLKFDLRRNRGVVVYSIFFASSHALGCDKMKQAMWQVDQTGNYQFRGQLVNQMEFEFGQDLEPLKEILLDRFGKKSFLKVEQIEVFMKSDRTLYHSGQFKRVLKELENVGALQVKESPGRRKGSFPRGTILQFMEQPLEQASLY